MKYWPVWLILLLIFLGWLAIDLLAGCTTTPVRKVDVPTVQHTTDKCLTASQVPQVPRPKFKAQASIDQREAEFEIAVDDLYQHAQVMQELIKPCTKE